MKGSQYVAFVPAENSRQRGSLAQFSSLAVSLTALTLMVLGAFFAWQWLDRNLLHWGLEDSKIVEVDSATLIERINAFELATVKHTYEVEARVDVSKALNAGPASVNLPSWMAGQGMNVEGVVVITAGVNLAEVSEGDLQIVRRDNEVQVIVTVPAPQILASELTSDSLDIETSQGFLTRITTSLGFSERDLRDEAVDRLVAAAQTDALENGVLEEASMETSSRLAMFLNSLPQASDERIVYVVKVQPPSV